MTPPEPLFVAVRLTCNEFSPDLAPWSHSQPRVRLTHRLYDGVAGTMDPLDVCLTNVDGQWVGPDGGLGAPLVALDLLSNDEPVEPVGAWYEITGLPGQTKPRKVKLLASMAPSIDLAELADAVIAQPYFDYATRAVVTSAVGVEEARAVAAEEANTTAISTEAGTRATADTALGESITAEIGRATAAETAIAQTVAGLAAKGWQANTAYPAETIVTDGVGLWQAPTGGVPARTTFTASDWTHLGDIALAVGTTAGTVMAGNDSRVTSLGTAATHAATDFDAAGVASSLMGAEQSRAEGVEATLATSAALGTEATTRATADTTNATAISAETTRATTAEGLKAPLASPALTGTPTAPTPSALDASTKVATTAYTDSAVGVEKTRAQTSEALAVHLAGAETITGVKTSTADAFFGSGRPWYDPMALGAKFDGATDDTTIWTALITAINTAGVPACIRLPHGASLITSAALPAITVPTFIAGSGSGPIATPSGSIVSFAQGHGGFTFSATAGGSAMEHLGLIGNAASAGTDNGVTALGLVRLYDVKTKGFSQDGFNLDTTSTGNVNHSSLIGCTTYENKRDGYHFDGPNTNTIGVHAPSSFSNGRWGYYSGHGTGTNVFTSAHAAANGTARTFTNVTVTQGSNVLASATANWIAGDWVVGTGIPTGAYVSVVSGTTATFLVAVVGSGATVVNATASNTNVSVVVTTGGGIYDNAAGNQYLIPYLETGDGFAFVAIDTACFGGVWLGASNFGEPSIVVAPRTAANQWMVWNGNQLVTQVPDPVMPQMPASKNYADTKAGLGSANTYTAAQSITGGVVNLLTAAESQMGTGAATFWANQAAANCSIVVSSAVTILGFPTYQITTNSGSGVNQFVLGNKVPVAGDVAYDVSVYAQNITGVAEGICRFLFEWFDSAGNLISTVTGSNLGTVTTTATQFSAAPATSPSSAATLRLGVQITGTNPGDENAWTNVAIIPAGTPQVTIDAQDIVAATPLRVAASSVEINPLSGDGAGGLTVGDGTGNQVFSTNAAGTVLSKAVVQPRSATALASAGAVTINASLGDAAITLSANATSSAITNPTSDQVLRITWIQNTTGGFTYAWPTNCKFAGGSAPSDTTASKRTTVTFRYDLTTTSWFELDRSVAVG